MQYNLLTMLIRLSFKLLMICLLSFLFVACTQKEILLDDLFLINNKYCFLSNGSNKSFTGTGYLKHKDGSLKWKVKFKDGIPNGNSVFYGFESDVISTAEYELIPFNFSGEKMKNVVRINLVKSLEGEYEYYTLLVICSSDNIDTKNLTDILKSSALSHLLKEEVTIKFAIGELSLLTFSEEEL
jgi:hypothetical protein